MCVRVRVRACECVLERKRAVAISHEAVSFFYVVVMSLANCCGNKQLSLLPLTYAHTNTFILQITVSMYMCISLPHSTYL